MKKTPVFIGSSIALTVVLYLLVYYLLPGPAPSPALITLLAGISVVVVWAVMSLRSKERGAKPSRATRKTHPVILFGAGWLALGMGTRANAFGPPQQAENAQAPTIRCSASPTKVTPGEAVTVTADAVSPRQRPLRYSYSANGGSISGESSTATLSTSGAAFGVITVTCNVVDDHGNTASTTVAVQILPPPMAPSQAPVPWVAPPPAGAGPPPSVKNSRKPSTRVTGTAVLLSGQKEPAGYGLYSYALLAHKPAQDELARQKAFLLELVKLPAAAGLEQYVDRSRINVTFIPLKEADRRWKQDSDDEKVMFILAHYDWERSAAILAALGQRMGGGPVLVSVLSPMDPSMSPHPVLLQDLSHAQAALMEAYVQSFVAQAAKDRFWDSAALAGFALNLRNLLETAAVAVGPGRDAVKSWVKVAN